MNPSDAESRFRAGIPCNDDPVILLKDTLVVSGFSFILFLAAPTQLPLIKKDFFRTSSPDRSFSGADQRSP